MISPARGGKIMHAFDVVAYKKDHPIINTLRDMLDAPAIHGTKVWNSSWIIMDYLERKGLAPETHVLDAGCGWGLTGIYCARRWGSHVTSIDADPNVFPFLDLHARTNEVDLDCHVLRYEDIDEQELRGYELVAGADICFWEELIDPLFNLIERAVAAGVPRILIADPGREPFDMLAARCRKKFNTRVTHRTVKEFGFTGDLMVIRGARK